MKFQIASLLSVLLAAASVNAGHRKHHNNDNSPPATQTTGAPSPAHTDNGTPPTVDPSTVTVQKRILKNPGVVRCWLDEYNQTYAILEMSDYAVSPRNKVAHYPFSAEDGKAKFTVKLDNGVEGFTVRMIQTWNLDHPEVSTDGKSFTFEEIEGGVNPGGTFMFLGAKSCYNGTISPPVNVAISATLNNGKDPLTVEIQN
jgi:hypothetical protein